MIVLQNWNIQGAAEHKFSLIQTYPSSADKFVYNLGIKIFDNQGNGYYTSFPPFSILAPYFIFSLLSSDFTVLNLQRFNLAGHFVATLVLYWVLCNTISRAKSFPSTASLVGAIAFVFAAPNLWYYSNVYSWDTFWHYLWIIGLLCVIKIHEDIHLARVNLFSLFVFGLVSFLITYSEYQGLLFVASVALWGFWNSKESRSYMKVALTATFAALLAVTVTALQYSSLAGTVEFARSVLQTLEMRSFLTDFDSRDIFRHYERGVGYVFPPVVVMTVALLIWGRKTDTWKLSSKERVLLFLVITPVATHHLVLPQWTATHDYSIVKSVVLVAIVLALLFQRLTGLSERRWFAVAAVAITLVYALLASLAVYRNEFASTANTRRYLDLGSFIGSTADKSEVVFAVSKVPIVPQVVYYSQRNIQTVDRQDHALEWLRYHRRHKGRVFHVDNHYKVVKVVSLSL